MTPLRRFEIHQPSNAAEASRMLAAFGEEAGLYAGGTELLLAMRHGALRYRHLVDVKVIPGFDSIELRDGWLRIGAGATHRAIERSPLVLENQRVLAEMESRVANVRVRASGTIGGNLCFAEPHSDPATLLLALDARAEAEGPGGRRELRIDELIAGAYTNGLAPDELLTAIHVPCASSKQRAAYVKFQVHERPTLGLALVLETPDSGVTISLASVALGCVCPFPRRSRTAEDLLIGSRDEVEAALARAAEVMADEAELIDDHEGGADYKRHLIGVFLRRAFEEALEKK
jgi:aerobic carbon-monoxide dehydrogenase medium subunit